MAEKTIADSILELSSGEIFTAKLSRSGNSMVVVVPPDVREKMKLSEGDFLLVLVAKR